MSDDFKPRPGSLADQVCRWFKANPGKELSGPTIRSTYGATYNAMHAQLGACEDADFLVSRREGVSNIYSAGPALATWTPEGPIAMPATQPMGLPFKPARKAGALPPPDELVIEDDIPPPGSNKSGGLYDAVFAAMRPGQSFSLPHAEAGRLKDSADRWSKRRADGKAKFAVRRCTNTHSRVWRTE